MALPGLAAEVYARPDGAPYVRNDRHGEDAPDRRVRVCVGSLYVGPRSRFLSKSMFMIFNPILSLRVFGLQEGERVSRQKYEVSLAEWEQYINEILRCPQMQ